MNALALIASLAIAVESPRTPAEAAADLFVPVEGAQLAVSLTLPDARPVLKAPAVLILPGSGPATRDGSRHFAEPFARAGFVVLTFDKRGGGASTGSWLKASLDDMARDGRTLLDWLKTRPEVDATRVGVVGVSQGGWVAPLVATERSDLSFLVALSGGAVSPRAIETFDYEGGSGSTTFKATPSRPHGRPSKGTSRISTARLRSRPSRRC